MHTNNSSTSSHCEAYTLKGIHVITAVLIYYVHAHTLRLSLIHRLFMHVTPPTPSRLRQTWQWHKHMRGHCGVWLLCWRLTWHTSTQQHHTSHISTEEWIEPLPMESHVCSSFLSSGLPAHAKSVFLLRPVLSLSPSHLQTKRNIIKT